LAAVAALEPLYESDREAADRALDALIDFLRMSLAGLRRAHGTVADECTLAAHYARAVLARFGAADTVSRSIAPDIGDWFVPPGMLLPFMQHMLAGAARRAQVAIAAVRDWTGLALHITAQSMPASPCGWRADLAMLGRELRAVWGAEVEVRGYEEPQGKRKI